LDTREKGPKAARRGQGTVLTHLDAHGQARMVDVGGKGATRREAIAEATVTMSRETLRLVIEGQIKKGDVFGTARLAGIMAAKKTPELIPLCHPLPIDAVDLEFRVDERASSVIIHATVGTTARTGVEMEAMVAVAVAALTIYDMCKAAEKGITIQAINLLRKSGGKSGLWQKS
jgi:cyclic pyranopterin monophosphate synthase